MAEAILVAFLMLLMGLEVLILTLAHAARDEGPLNRKEEFSEGIRREGMSMAAGIFGRFLYSPKEFDAEVLDKEILARVQKYLETEQTMAAEFVSKPSFEALYRESGRDVLS